MSATASSMSNLLVAFLFTATLGTVAQQPIDRSALPPAVEKTVQQQSQGATLKGFTVGTDNGNAVYEAIMTVDGHPKTIEIDHKGVLMGVEKDVTLDALPSNLQNAVTSRVNGANITGVQSLTLNGVIVGYKATTEKDGKIGEVHVTTGH